jgi:tripartite-type tricarboxylate transporter receptor subunit TctC
MISKKLMGLAAALSLAALAATAPAKAQSVADFYRGKTITVLIGYGAGGTDDIWARLISRYMSRYIPGEPTVIASNMPGAGSLLVTNQIYNTQPKDGTVIGLINRGVPFEPLLGGTGTRFDAQKLNYIGSPDVDTPVCAVRMDAPVQKMEELMTKELILGATGSGADSQSYPDVLSKLLGVKMKIVQGYPGSRDILLAMERNEVQGVCVSYDTVVRSNIFREKRAKILFQAALERDDRIPDVPMIQELAKTDEQKQALQLFLQRTLMGRPFVMGPNVPADRLDAIRKAFELALKDPGFAADARGADVNIHYVSPDRLLKVVADAYATPASSVEAVKKALGR